MIDDDDVFLVSPVQFNNLRNLARGAGITPADITAIEADRVERRFFEMGEAVYVVVTNIHATTVPETSGYRIEAEIGTGTTNSNRNRNRQMELADVVGAADPLEGGVASYILRTEQRHVKFFRSFQRRFNR
jgi:hypothetical protein